MKITNCNLPLPALAFKPCAFSQSLEQSKDHHSYLGTKMKIIDQT